MCWKYSRSTDIHSQTEIISQTFKSKTNKHQIKLELYALFVCVNMKILQQPLTTTAGF